ncbi:thioredoxin family protein [Allokutzneria sp. NRRL B-24872]|uniref:TlpA family protein disulfide reductase n=1 Tax=Allokutzneria sp. NRRL B-24872 TaxID=1137961 RepID=UPI001FEEBA29|nr:thioredoxin family protein [Allokutzneria sp. NRRL B-24872]
MTGFVVVLAAIAVTVAVGLLHRKLNGRVRQKGQPVEVALPAPVRTALDAAPDAGAPVTLLQFSTTFCAPCRHARVLLADLAGRTEGLRHVDFDLTAHPEVAEQLRVLRTPTTLALAPDGRELLRVSGLPKRDALVTALRPHLP